MDDKDKKTADRAHDDADRKHEDANRRHEDDRQAHWDRADPSLPLTIEDLADRISGMSASQARDSTDLRVTVKEGLDRLGSQVHALFARADENRKVAREAAGCAEEAKVMAAAAQATAEAAVDKAFCGAQHDDLVERLSLTVRAEISDGVPKGLDTWAVSRINDRVDRRMEEAHKAATDARLARADRRVRILAVGIPCAVALGGFLTWAIPKLVALVRVAGP